MKIKKRKDGRVMKSRTVNGKRVYGYGPTQKAALEDLERKVAGIKAGTYKPGKELTLDEYFERWKKGRELSVRASTLYSQECKYRKASAFPIDNVGHTLGSLRLSKIEAQNIRDLQTHLAEKHSTGYTNQVIGVIRHMLNDAAKERIINWNPCDALKSVKRTEEEARDTVHRALTVEETVKFFEAAKGSYYIHLYTLLINTGLRIGEAGGICFRHKRREDQRKADAYKVQGRQYRGRRGRKDEGRNKDGPAHEVRRRRDRGAEGHKLRVV